VFAELGAKVGLDLLEVERLHARTGAAVDSRLVADDLGAKRLREATVRLTEVALEELDDGRRQVVLVCTLEQVLCRDLVLRHPLREVANDLRRRRDLD
jgi:hypothetical protein